MVHFNLKLIIPFYDGILQDKSSSRSPRTELESLDRTELELLDWTELEAPDRTELEYPDSSTELESHLNGALF